MIHIPPHCSHSSRRQNRLSHLPQRNPRKCSGLKKVHPKIIIYSLWWSMEKTHLTLVVSGTALLLLVIIREWPPYIGDQQRRTHLTIMVNGGLRILVDCGEGHPSIGIQLGSAPVHLWLVEKGPLHWLSAVKNSHTLLVIGRGTSLFFVVSREPQPYIGGQQKKAHLTLIFSSM